MPGGAGLRRRRFGVERMRLRRHRGKWWWLINIEQLVHIEYRCGWQQRRDRRVRFVVLVV